jgi:hypothetical protein
MYRKRLVCAAYARMNIILSWEGQGVGSQTGRLRYHRRYIGITMSVRSPAIMKQGDERFRDRIQLILAYV